MHIVHRKINDADEVAGNDADDFAVLGTFFAISNNLDDVDLDADQALRTLTQYFRHIQYKGKGIFSLR